MICGIWQTMRGKPDGAQSYSNQQNAQNEADITDSIYNERLFTRIGGRLFKEIKTDEQVAAEADAFPSDEHEEHVVGKDEGEHGEHEKIHLAEEAVVAAFVAHVADGVD